MNQTSEEKSTESRTQLISWDDFLKSAPPDGKIHHVSDVFTFEPATETYLSLLPVLDLFCDSDICNGMRQFETQNNLRRNENEPLRPHILEYTCRNCRQKTKQYFILIKPMDKKDSLAEIVKIGEHPPYGPHIPNKLKKLLDDENIKLLRQGRRAESLGLGIGAFTYYRRVVENQKTQLIEKIIEVAETIKSDKEMIETLRKSKEARQFSRSVELLKDAIPDSLKIGNYNPLSLLHNALSIGIHSESDEECLSLATHIRNILSKFSEKLDEALKDDAEINQAVKALTTKSK